MSTTAYHVLTFQLPDFTNDFSDFFYQLGCIGIEPQKGRRIKVYFPAQISRDQLLKQVQSHSSKIELILETTIGVATDKGFGISSFAPKELVGDIRVVSPDFSDPKRNDIILNCASAFGSGNHQTTQLVARQLYQIDVEGKSVLDMGCGSGILTLLADKLGFEKLTAVEILPEALENAKENFTKNNISGISVFSHLEDVRDSFDVILANMLAPTLIYFKDKLMSLLNEKGLLILSGITEPDLIKIKDAFAGLKQIQQTQEEKWFCLIFKKE